VAQVLSSMTTVWKVNISKFLKNFSFNFLKNKFYLTMDGIRVFDKFAFSKPRLPQVILFVMLIIITMACDVFVSVIHIPVVADRKASCRERV